MATYVEGNIVYEVSLDTKNLLANAGTVREQLLKLKANGQDAAQGLDKVDKSAGNASNSLGKLTTIAKAVSAALVSSQIIAYAQSWNELEDRIANTGATATQTKDIMEQLLETSNRNGRSIEESSELYIRLSNSMKEMGYSTSGTLDYIDTLSNLLTINKTNTLAAESAMNALTRAQMKGKLSGQEALSVFNAMPSILKTLGNRLNKTETEVRSMANAGQLSMREFSRAIIESQEETATLADNMRNNVSDGITRITNNLKQYFGELNNATGGTKLIVDALILMSQHVNILATGVGVLGAIYAGKYITSLAAATKQSAAKVIADIKQAATEKAAAAAALEQAKAETTNALAAQKSLAAQLALAQTEQTRNALRQQLKANTVTLTAAINAETAAQARLAAAAKVSSFALNGLKSAMNLLGGPAGILLIAAGAMYSWIASNEAAKEKALGLGDYIDDLRAKYEKLNEEQKKYERTKLTVEIDKTTEALKNQNWEVQKATSEYTRYQNKLNSDFTGLFSSESKLNEKALAVAEAKKEQSKMQENLNRLLQTQQDIINGTLDKPETKSDTPTVDTTAYDKQLEALNSLLEKKKEGVELSKVNAEIENGIFKDLEPQQKAELQRVADLVDKMRERQQLEKDRQVAEGQKFGDQVMYDNKSDLEKVEADQQAKIEKLNYYNDLGAYNEQQYQDRLTAINEAAAKKRKKIDDDEKAAKLANASMILSSTSDIFSGLADIAKTYEGKSSSTYKALYAISKGFAIANASLNLYTAISNASTLQPPASYAAMAQAASAGASLVSQISSATYGGGRLNGGDVSASSYYRVGENNKPEILQSGSRQYLIPGENGKVISNKDITGSPSSATNIVWEMNIINNTGGDIDPQPDVNNDARIVNLTINKVASGIREKNGAVWNALKTTTNVTPRLR